MQIEPLLVTVAQTSEVGGWSRSITYQLLASGVIRSVKVGKRRLIDYASLRSYIAGLPWCNSKPTTNQQPL